jgi:tetraacyldisaccharide 4'-kinase
VGGRAKTPLAALVASRLLQLGERPAILSRGYARRDPADGVVVVRDPLGIRADLDRAGDEPLMLARALDGVAVLACPDRYLAGRLAEHHFGCTVHVLDDGFQHFALRRDADLVAIAREDLERPETLPGGRLREPLETAASADALIALDDLDPGDVARVAGTRPVWRARRRPGAPRQADGGAASARAAGRVVAVAGIADPSAFFRSLRASGWTVASEVAFADHHPYSAAEARGIFAAARTVGARAIVTTEKDLVRLLPYRPFPLPVMYVPLELDVESAASFDAWLGGVLEGARR